MKNTKVGPQQVAALSTDMTDVAATFEELFSPLSLIDVFLTKFSNTESRGVDRKNGTQFSRTAVDEIHTISRKCLNGSYRFSPYLENLKAKGRGKIPRLISIPTIRDRIVLHQLNKLLARAFPECVPRNVASTYIRKIAEDLASKAPEKTYVCGSDIKTFYDGINQERLLSQVNKRLPHKSVTRVC